jgi:hypothetical protein
MVGELKEWIGRSACCSWEGEAVVVWPANLGWQVW